VSPYDTLPGLNNLTFFAENIEAYSWGVNGVEGSILEGEALGPIFNWGATEINEAIMKNRAHASDGCEIWKYNPEDTPKWTSVMTGGNGDSTNWGAGVLTEFNGYLFAGTWSSPEEGKGCEIWRFDGSTWTTVVGDGADVGDGFGDHHNMAVTSMCEFNERLYVGTMNFNWENDGFCQVWRTTNDDGTEWEQVIDEGFREIYGVESTARNAYAWRMAEFKGNLYVSTFNIPIPTDGQRGCQLFRTETGKDDWEKVNLPNGDGFGEKFNYGIRGLIPWAGQDGQDQYLYVGVAACFFQIKTLLWYPLALEIWRYDGTTEQNAWVPIVGDEVTQNQEALNYDGFGSYYNKYPWSMLRCNDELWIGTWNYQINGIPQSHGCEVYCVDGSTITAIVKDKNEEQSTEKQSGFGYQWNVGARSMIEYPKGSGWLVVGTVSLKDQYDKDVTEKGCEVWIRHPWSHYP
jgi:hypothetical protein